MASLTNFDFKKNIDILKGNRALKLNILRIHLMV